MPPSELLSGLRRLLVMFAIVSATGCQSMSQPPMETVDHVNLQRFMGDWYVIASIPTFLEKNAYNAVESYNLNTDGSIATVFTFRDGGFDGELKRYTPTGYVEDEATQARWGMQFVWPIKADYRVIYLADDYSATVVGRKKRDYVWIMARTPQLPEAQYRQLVNLVSERGYDASKLRVVPQQPLQDRVHEPERS